MLLPSSALLYGDSTAPWSGGVPAMPAMPPALPTDSVPADAPEAADAGAAVSVAADAGVVMPRRAAVVAAAAGDASRSSHSYCGGGGGAEHAGRSPVLPAATSSGHGGRM